MLALHIGLALLIAQCYAETCGVFDGNGNLLGNAPHLMGSFKKNVQLKTVLPGELRLENMRPVFKAGNCKVYALQEGNRLQFASGEIPDDMKLCSFDLWVEPGAGCPEGTPKSVKHTIQYYIEDGVEFWGFVQDSYKCQETFPVPKGARLGDIEVSSLNFSTRVELEENFDGVEIVQVESFRDGIARFEVRTTRLLHLLEDLNLTMIATSGGLSSKAFLEIRLNEDSALPHPEFEKMSYVVQLNASDLGSPTNVYPAGTIRLKEDYRHVRFDLFPLNYNELDFEVESKSEGTVDVRLAKVPDTNLSSQDVVLLLTARIRNQFGGESEGFTTLLIEVEGNQTCLLGESPLLYETNNEQHLQIAVAVLSVVIVILLLVIIFLYFKYVCVKKKEAPVPCKKCSEPVSVKTRRPTPRKISEYPYPLDVLPPPLETLAEVETEEGEAKPLDIKVTTPKGEISVLPTNGVKTRKRSMTFRESDEEARQYREAPPVTEVSVHQNDRKVSNESQRKISAEEERRRRKSSIKMYRCLT